MINKLEQILDGFEDLSMMVFMSVAITLTFSQVIMRYAFNAPLFWAEEVVLYSIICMSFIGISYGIKHQSHIAVEVLNAFMPNKYQKHLSIAQGLIGIVFSLVLLYLGWKLVSVTFSRGQLSSALRIPIAWVYLAIPIAGASATFRYARQINNVVKRTDVSSQDEPVNMM